MHALRISRFFTLAAASLAISLPALAAEIKVMTSGGFTAPYQELTPQFEKATGHKVVTAYGASQGGAPDSIPSRLDRGEPVDIVILAAPALDGLIKQGKVQAGSRVDLVRSAIGMSVKAGAPKPDISTVEALKKTLREAKSIAYSASASGTYLSTVLFPQLGIWTRSRASRSASRASASAPSSQGARPRSASSR
jgi:molybdate transport system substrate-binding protein